MSNNQAHAEESPKEVDIELSNSPTNDSPYAEKMISTAGVDLFSCTEGNKSSPALVLVHGYPDNHHVWDRVSAILSKQFYVIRYDVRGAGQSATPEQKMDYELATLAEDLKAVVDYWIPNQRFHLAGHDWGSVQSWESVTSEPLRSRILSFTTLSGPSLDHGSRYLKSLLGSTSFSDKATYFKLILKSWYIAIFHLPLIAPCYWKFGNMKSLSKLMGKSESIDQYATQRKDGFNGIQLYRSNFIKRYRNPEVREVKAPVQILVASDDSFVSEKYADAISNWVPELYRRNVKAGHWDLLLKEPAALAEWIREFSEGVENNKIPTSLKNRRVHDRSNSGSNAGNSPLASKIVLISGAGSGIGRATALKVAQEGADLILTDINSETLMQTKTQCETLGVKVWERLVDVGKLQEIEALVSWSDDICGGPDIVVNNAGIGYAGSVLDMPSEDWDRLFNINMWGVINGSRLFAEQMIKEKRPGHIVNISSAAAFLPSKMLGAYSTTKAAVYMFSESLRADLSEYGIGVSTVCPGVIATNIVKNTKVAGMSEVENREFNEKTDKLYKKRNLGPEAVAEKIFGLIMSNKPLAMVGVEASIIRTIFRFFPSLSRRIAKFDP